jgi:hypothetical protein
MKTFTKTEEFCFTVPTTSSLNKGNNGDGLAVLYQLEMIHEANVTCQQGYER